MFPIYCSKYLNLNKDTIITFVLSLLIYDITFMNEKSNIKLFYVMLKSTNKLILIEIKICKTSFLKFRAATL